MHVLQCLPLFSSTYKATMLFVYTYVVVFYTQQLTLNDDNGRLRRIGALLQSGRRDNVRNVNCLYFYSNPFQTTQGTQVNNSDIFLLLI